MKTYVYPDEPLWNDLCQRPGIVRADLENIVNEILTKVKSEKDSALYHYAQLFDGFTPESLRVQDKEIAAAADLVPGELRNAIATAVANIEKFHSAQLRDEEVVETFPGVRCWRKSAAIEKVGLYIPGGSAPLFSTLLMLGIPAKIAGCKEIVICTPAGKDGKVNPVILYTASMLGLNNIFRVGGAQAIAAMAYGTESIPAVYKIFGPGNQYVMKAKEMVQRDGVAIDMPAGPSEVLVIADSSANPAYIAADLLSQAEHGPDSQVIMLTDSDRMINRVQDEIVSQTRMLPRKDTVKKSLASARFVLMKSLDDCIRLSNVYAPEHLIINTAEPHKLAVKVGNAGSVFLGSYSCESMGDYASGTNHTLPTNAFARNYSGLSTESFMKKITFQELNSNGLRKLGPSVELMASAESLDAHRNAVSIRLKDLAND
jgi:histidinol dehydrogenase